MIKIYDCVLVYTAETHSTNMIQTYLDKSACCLLTFQENEQILSFQQHVEPHSYLSCLCKSTSASAWKERVFHNMILFCAVLLFVSQHHTHVANTHNTNTIQTYLDWPACRLTLVLTLSGKRPNLVVSASCWASPCMSWQTNQCFCLKWKGVT